MAQSIIYALSLPSVGSVRVDRSGRGIIRGAALASSGEARGHGFALDEVSLSQVEELGEGIQGRWTHPTPFSDGLGSFLGRWKNVRRVGAKTLGDFHFSEAAHQYHPPGLKVSAAQWLMDRAEQDPDVLGVSIVAELDVEQVGEESALRRVARIQSLSAADFVSDPAANEALFSSQGAKMPRREKLAEEEEEKPEEEAPAEEAPADELEEEATEEEAPAEPEAEAEPGAEEEAPDESLSDKVSALEDRIAVLEAQLEQAEKETEEAEKAGDALRSELETYRLAALQAKESQRTEFLEVLAASSAALNQPISARDLALVESRFSAGDDEGARAIGEAFLARAQALSTAGGSGELRKLGPDKLDGKRATVEQTARYLRHGGLDFDLADDGTKIINKRRRSR